MMETRALGGHAMGAARDLPGATRFAAYAAGQAAAVAHVAAHVLGAAAYAIKSAQAAVSKVDREQTGRFECNGSANNFHRRSGNLCLMISVYVMMYVGVCLVKAIKT
jgi:hypothetical protein